MAQTFLNEVDNDKRGYLWSLVKQALVASEEPCANSIARTQDPETPSHIRILPSLLAVTYIPPVVE